MRSCCYIYIAANSSFIIKLKYILPCSLYNICTCIYVQNEHIYVSNIGIKYSNCKLMSCLKQINFSFNIITFIIIKYSSNILWRYVDTHAEYSQTNNIVCSVYTLYTQNTCTPKFIVNVLCIYNINLDLTLLITQK